MGQVIEKTGWINRSLALTSEHVAVVQGVNN